jgi:hypothetical protein
MFSKVLLNTLILALAVDANPLISRDSLLRLAMSKKLNIGNASNILQIDQQRARQLSSRSSYGSSSVNEGATNVASSYYTVSVGVGSPPTECMAHASCPLAQSIDSHPDNLLVDTGR